MTAPERRGEPAGAAGTPAGAASRAFDRAAFLRPTAHRGLHDAGAGVIENSAPAFAAALARGYGIECDLRPAVDGTPIVFHDETLARLVDADGRVADLAPAALARLAYRGARDGTSRIITFAELIELVGGRVPLLVEVKSEWRPPDPAFLRQVATIAAAGATKGPLALMSFDPAVVAALGELAPAVPRGIVSGLYQGSGWWLDRLDGARAFRLSHLLESRACELDFVAYHVADLPTPVTRFVREALAMPLFTWTVRTAAHRATAAEWADAMIFEGFVP